jgi:hypothetical protein
MSPLFGPDATTILRDGASLPGLLVGIKVTLPDGDSATERHEFAVEAGGRLFGIRQNLSPIEEVRLGMPLTVRIQGSDAIIEWGDVDLSGWKSVAPPERGITDRRDSSDNPTGLDAARRKGESVTAEFLAFPPRKALFGAIQVTDAHCRVITASGAASETKISRFEPPFYATHLITVGTRVPAWNLRGFLGERLVIDWPAAAEATPGIGVPAAADVSTRFTGGRQGMMSAAGDGDTDDTQDSEIPEIPEFAQSILTRFGVSLEGGSGETEIADPVSWEQFVQIEHDIAWIPVKKRDIEAHAVSLGIPAGEWPAAQRRWQERMSDDLSLAQKYGQAMSRP